MYGDKRFCPHLNVNGVGSTLIITNAIQARHLASGVVGSKHLRSDRWRVTNIGSATYNLATVDVVNIVYTPTGSHILTLATTQSVKGRIIRVKDSGGNAGVNKITIKTANNDLIDDSSEAVMIGDYDSLDLSYSGSKWLIH